MGREFRHTSTHEKKGFASTGYEEQLNLNSYILTQNSRWPTDGGMQAKIFHMKTMRSTLRLWCGSRLERTVSFFTLEFRGVPHEADFQS